MIGLEVVDVEAVWRRLWRMGVGKATDDGAELLGEVRGREGGRRSVCLVDLAGHCGRFGSGAVGMRREC